MLCGYSFFSSSFTAGCLGPVEGCFVYYPTSISRSLLRTTLCYDSTSFLASLSRVDNGHPLEK